MTGFTSRLWERLSSRSSDTAKSLPHDLRRLFARLCLVVLVIALVARVCWGTAQLTRAQESCALEFPDEAQYWQMAQSLRDGDGLRDELGFRATRMPLFPALLAPFAGAQHGVIVAKATQWAIGALVAALTVGFAAAMFDRRVGLVAGLLVAVDPFLVFFSSLLLTETLFLAALVAFWWILWRAAGFGPRDDAICDTPARERPRGPKPAARWGHDRRAPARNNRESYGRWLAAGFAAALCVYVRESSVGLVLVGLGFVLIARRFNRRALIGVVITVGVVVASLLPWAARNYGVTGHWCWLTHRGGISLYDGVGPQATGASDLGRIKQMPAVAGLDEVEWNRYFLNESIRAIRSDPGRILRLAGVKIARMWNPLPNAPAYRSDVVRVVAAAWTIPIFVLALGGVILGAVQRERHGPRTVVFLLLPALYLTALHSLFVGSVRYRLGAMPLVEVLAAVAVVWMIGLARKGPSAKSTAIAN